MVTVTVFRVCCEIGWAVGVSRDGCTGVCTETCFILGALCEVCLTQLVRHERTKDGLSQLGRKNVHGSRQWSDEDTLTDAKVETGVFVVGGLTEMLIQRAYTDVVQRSSYDAFLSNVTGHILRSYGITPEQHALLPIRPLTKD